MNSDRHWLDGFKLPKTEESPLYCHETIDKEEDTKVQSNSLKRPLCSGGWPAGVCSGCKGNLFRKDGMKCGNFNCVREVEWIDGYEINMYRTKRQLRNAMYRRKYYIKTGK